MAEDFNLALPADTNFQRQMAKRMKSRTPVEIRMQSGAEHCGWISGLDDDTIQLCSVESFRMIWVFRDHIESVNEHTLKIKLTPFQDEELSGYISRMEKNATKALEK
jgi:hypothetical protein